MSNYANATITSATYDTSTGTLVVTGDNFSRVNGSNNDVVPGKLTLTGDNGGTYVLTSNDVDVTNKTNFTITLNTSDKLVVNGLLNKSGLKSDSDTTYNLAASDDWLAGSAPKADISDLTSNPITVSNVVKPTLTSATYDAVANVLVVTGTNFVSKIGTNNDVDVSRLTLTGDESRTYTLTSSSVEITDTAAFSVTLNATDQLAVGGLLNKNGTTSGSGATYNLAAADNWLAGAATSVSIDDLTNNSITVSNVTSPTMTSATYDASTGVLVATGANFVGEIGENNDVDVTKITLSGEGDTTYTLTSSNVDVSSATQLSVTLTAADQVTINGLLNQNGTRSEDNSTYNIALADNWMTGAAVTTDIADSTGNEVVVSNVTTPTIAAATYTYTTGVLNVTSTNLRHKTGANNDVDITKLSLSGEGKNTYTLTGTSVDVTSTSAFSITLSETDKINVNGLLNKDATQSDGATTYNLAAADNWLTAALSTIDISDATSAINVSGYAAPVITSITYNHETGVITVSGSNFVKQFGNSNDVDVSLFTFTGENGQTYTLSSTADIELTSSTSFSFTLTGADLSSVNALVTANGTLAASGTTYSIALADNWMTGAPDSINIANPTSAITVSGVPTPSIISATYDTGTGLLTVTGNDFKAKTGDANDVSVAKLTVTGEGGQTYTLTTSDVEASSTNTFSVSLNSADKLAVNGLFDTNGIASDDNTTYNLAAADDFIAEATGGDTADSTSMVTVSGVASPSIDTATYNALTGQLRVTGTHFAATPGAANDVDVSLLTLTGQGASTYTINNSSDAELTSTTEFTITLSGADMLAVNGLLNVDGQTSGDGTTYNLASTDNWLLGVANSLDIADIAASITASNVLAPTLTSFTYDASSGSIAAVGTGFANQPGDNNDVDVSLFTITGESGITYTLTAANDVDVSSTTELSFTVSGNDKLNADGLFNKDGALSDNGTPYNIAVADNWLTASATETDISDTTTSVNVSNVSAPSITSATYNGVTGLLYITGSQFRSLPGEDNDLVVTTISLSGQGESTYTLTSNNVDIIDATSASITLNTEDKKLLQPILNKDGLSAQDGTIYNIAFSDNWMASAATSTNIADLTGNPVSVTDSNSSPTIDGSPFDSVAQGAVYSFIPTVIDQNNDALTFSIINKPIWAAFSSNTGALTGTPGNSHVGTTSNIVISVSDGTASASLTAFSLTVTNVNDAPVISEGDSIAVVMSEDATPTAFSLILNASDIDIGDSLNWSIASVADDGIATVSPNGESATISYVPEDDFNGSDSFTINVSDAGNASDTITVNVTIEPVNDVPVLTGTPGSNAPEGAAYSFTPTVSDVDGDNLTFSVTNQPNWTEFNTSTGALTGTPTANDIGRFEGIVISVNDGNGGEVSLPAFTIQTIGNDVQPPVFAGDLSTLTAEATGELTSVTLPQPQVTDDRSGNTSLSLDNSGPFPLGVTTITWTATDAAGNSATATQQVLISDTTPPDMPVLNLIEVYAQGLLTDVLKDVTDKAIDLVDGEIALSVEGNQQRESGAYELTLFAQDSSGNRASQTVTANVYPGLMLGDTLIAAPGAQVSVPVNLTGKAVSYPVVIKYRVSTLGEFEVQLNEGMSGTLDFKMPSDSVDGDIIELTIQDVINAAVSGNHSVQVQALVENVAPVFTIQLQQNAIDTRILNKDGGNGMFTVTIEDVNPQDAHQVNWSVPAMGVTDTGNVLALDPAPLNAGTYVVSATVTETNTTQAYEIVQSLTFSVPEQNIVLSENEDSDGDGINDAQEGFGDSDGDGIPDHLDSDENASRLPLANSQEPVQIAPGLSIAVGNIGVQASNGLPESGSLTDETLGQVIGERYQSDNQFTPISDMMNFIVSGMQTVGQQVAIVVPLPGTTTIPENAAYRKYSEGKGWYDFVADDNNSITSSPRTDDGNCPATDAITWRNGLNEGDSCFKLLIQDGGLYDTDGQANGVIEDPGVLATAARVTTAFDYDGDGAADLAVRRPDTFYQYIKETDDGTIQRIEFGDRADDIPISGDFDGDKIVDIGVRRPGIQYWYILNSSGSTLGSDQNDNIQQVIFGEQLEDVPVPADYDGDGITDFAVRRPSTQYWYIKNSSGVDHVTGNSDGITRRRFGRQEDDIPVPADYDGDGKADLAVRRPATQYWYILNSAGVDNITGNSDGITRRRFGKQENDIPVPADYDGDGKVDIAVRRPSTFYWYILNSSGSNVGSNNNDGIQRIQFGRDINDIPVPADYDGDGKADIAVRRPATFYWYIVNSSGSNIGSDRNDGIQRIQFGLDSNDIPLAAPLDTRINGIRINGIPGSTSPARGTEENEVPTHKPRITGEFLLEVFDAGRDVEY